MTVTEHIITIALCALATMLTRFLPFLLFSGKRKTPEYITYLGKALPAAIFGMLVVYCLKSVDIAGGCETMRQKHFVVALCPLFLLAQVVLWLILLAQGLTREEVEDLWSTGRGKKRQSLGRVNTRRAQPICGSLVDRAMYMLKAPKHRKKWHQSLGLKMPEVRLNDNRYTKRQILKWCTNGDAYDRDFWAKKYPTWKVSEAAVEFNDIEGAYYVRLRLWRDKSPWKESPTRAGRTARTGQPPAMAAARHTKRTAKSGTST